MLPIVFVSLYFLKTFVFGAYLTDVMVLGILVGFAAYSARQHKKSELALVQDELSALKEEIKTTNADLTKIKTHIGTTKLSSAFKA